MSKSLQIEALFFAALDKRTAEERQAFLDAACGGDALVRRKVDRLLKAHSKVGTFLAKPVGEQLSADAASADVTQSLNALADTDGVQPKRPPRVRIVEDLADDLVRTEGIESVQDEEVPLDFLESSTRSDALGRIGHYEVLEVLGRGGFGIVFRAFDDMLQRVVAIKVLAPQLAATSPARKRFLREARSSAKVRHEHIVHVYAVEEQPLPFLVMEFIPGETLQQRLDRVGPLDAVETAQIGRQIAEGLAAAHRTGLIHRDIKPANILLDSGTHLRVKITDFGLARAADDASVTQSGIIAGTPMYMAPEQAQGEAFDHRADLFSLGSVLYTMCSGRPPFRANSTLAVLKRVAEDTPRPIPEIIPEVPRWLCDIITHLHAKRPEDRIATAQEVAELLQRGLAEKQLSGSTPELATVAPAPVEAPPPASEQLKVDTSVPVEVTQVAVDPRPRFPMRHRAIIAAGLLLFVVGMGLTEASGVTNVRGTIIRLFSPEGTLVVEVDDPAVKIKIDGADLVITGAGVREIRLQPGSYTVEASKGGKLVRRELVSVTKNGRQVVRVSQEPASSETQPATTTTAKITTAKTTPDEATTEKTAVVKTTTDDTAAWERSIAALPAEEQVKAFGLRMKELNPGFDGNITPKIEGSVVTGLTFLTDHVENIAPIRALQGLTSLTCYGTFPRKGILSDLSPLKGMSLTKLDCSNTKVSDLTALIGMPLTVLEVNHGPVSDLSPLQGMPLEVLGCASTEVTDLSPLKGLKLRSLTAMTLKLKDLTPLQGMPLKQLDLAFGSGISDVQPLQGMPLEYLNLTNLPVTDFKFLKEMQSLRTLVLDGTQLSDLRILSGLQLVALGVQRTTISDLSPLKGMPLRNFICTSWTQRDADLLRTISTLEWINHKPAAEFWRKVESREAEFQTWLQQTLKLPAAEQVVAVTAKLKERNPAWDGNLTHQIENGVVTAITVWSHVKDISPVRALAGLKSFTCDQLSGGRVLSDVTPLKDLPLTSVALHFTQVADLSPLQGKPLTYLDLWGSQFVSDLSVVKDMPLTELNCANTAVSDLSPLKDLKTLQKLDCFQTFVRDASPLKDLKLTYLILSRTGVTDMSPLKDMKLTHLYMQDSVLSDLSPLKDMPLVSLDIHNSQVADLSPLRNMKLTTLDCSVSSVSDLSPLQGMPLKRLLFCQTGVTDLSPLQGMDLDEVRLTPGKIVPGLTLLREMKNLKTIWVEIESPRPAAEFWERYDKGEFKK